MKRRQHRLPLNYQPSTTHQTLSLPATPLDTVSELPHDSPLLAALSTSGSLGLVATTVCWLYGVDYQFAVNVALVPWAVYGVGKSLYLILLLGMDILSLFPSQPRVIANNDRYPIPIIREEDDQ
jgi:hypothetical protein